MWGFADAPAAVRAGVVGAGVGVYREGKVCLCVCRHPSIPNASLYFGHQYVGASARATQIQGV